MMAMGYPIGKKNLKGTGALDALESLQRKALFKVPALLDLIIVGLSEDDKMKKFKVSINGENLEILENGKAEFFGFYTTRYVEADSPLAAENIALSLVGAELEGVLCKDRSVPPVISVEEIQELEVFGDYLVPGQGFSWYNESDQS